MWSCIVEVWGRVAWLSPIKYMWYIPHILATCRICGIVRHTLYRDVLAGCVSVMFY